MSALVRIPSDRQNFSHCRFCAIQKHTEELLDFTAVLQKYQKMLSYIKLELDLSVSSKLPKHTCFDCHNKCLETYNFFITVKKTQKILINLYESNDAQENVNESGIKSEIDDADDNLKEKSCDEDNTIHESECCTEQHENNENESSLLPKEELNDENDEIDNSNKKVDNLSENGNHSNDDSDCTKEELDDANDEIDNSHKEVDNFSKDGNNSNDEVDRSNEKPIKSESDEELENLNVEIDNTNEEHDDSNDEHDNSNELNNSQHEDLVFYENLDNLNKDFNNLQERQQKQHHNSNEQLLYSLSHVTVDNNTVSKEVTITNRRTYGRISKRYIDKNDAIDIETSKLVSHNNVIDNNIDTGNEAEQSKDVNPNTSAILDKNVNTNISRNKVEITRSKRKYDETDNEAGQNIDVNPNSSTVQDINVNTNISYNTVEIERRKYVYTYTGNEVLVKHKIETKQMKYADGYNIKTDSVTVENDETISTAIENNKHVNNTGIETDYGPKNIDENAVSEKGETEFFNENSSWIDYPWSCGICKEKSGNIDEAREHSKHAHNYCYGFSCADCDKDFNTYNTLVEHVRTHRQHLRLYCQYCNQKFENATECFEHSLEHWTGPQTICELCGEIFPNESRLKSHRKAYKHKPLNRRTKRRHPKLIMRFSSSTWKDYVWSCLDCFKVLPDLQSLRIHIRAVHRRCFAMKCSDCLRVLYNFAAFTNHVREHRLYYNHICHYCDVYVNNKDLKTHIEQHFTDENPCYGCGEIFANKELLQQHMVDYGAPARYKLLKDTDYTCNVCHKIYKSISLLKNHKKIHDRLERNFVCAVCGNGFYDYGYYAKHLKLHDVKAETCEVCQKSFATKSSLKSHAKTHITDKPFSCDECKKCFKNKSRVLYHMRSHTDVKPFVCVVCDKRFKTKSALNNHRNQHTGSRPYKCEICEQTFTNGPNCNKHMIRKHGVSFYKSKHTSLGKIEIDKESGKVKEIAIDENAKEWLSKVMERSKPGRSGKKKE